MSNELILIATGIVAFIAGIAADMLIKQPNGPQLLQTILTLVDTAVLAAEQSMKRHNTTVSNGEVKSDVTANVQAMAKELGLRTPSAQLLHNAIEASVHRLPALSKALLSAAPIDLVITPGPTPSITIATPTSAPITITAPLATSLSPLQTLLPIVPRINPL